MPYRKNQKTTKNKKIGGLITMKIILIKSISFLRTILKSITYLMLGGTDACDFNQKLDEHKIKHNPWGY